MPYTLTIPRDLARDLLRDFGCDHAPPDPGSCTTCCLRSLLADDVARRRFRDLKGYLGDQELRRRLQVSPRAYQHLINAARDGGPIADVHRQRIARAYEALDMHRSYEDWTRDEDDTLAALGQR